MFVSTLTDDLTDLQDGGSRTGQTEPMADTTASDEPQDQTSTGTAEPTEEQKRQWYADQYRRLEEALEAQIQEDLPAMRAHLGDTVDEPTLREAWEFAGGDVADAIAICLVPAYKRTIEDRYKEAGEQRSAHVHDVQTENLHVDAQTAIQRLRMLSNAKDMCMNEMVVQKKAQQAAQQRNEAAESPALEGNVNATSSDNNPNVVSQSMA